MLFPITQYMEQSPFSLPQSARGEVWEESLSGILLLCRAPWLYFDVSGASGPMAAQLCVLPCLGRSGQCAVGLPLWDWGLISPEFAGFHSVKPLELPTTRTAAWFIPLCICLHREGGPWYLSEYVQRSLTTSDIFSAGIWAAQSSMYCRASCCCNLSYYLYDVEQCWTIGKAQKLSKEPVNTDQLLESEINTWAKTVCLAISCAFLTRLWKIVSTACDPCCLIVLEILMSQR